MRSVFPRLSLLSVSLSLVGCIASKPIVTIDPPLPLQLDDRVLVVSPDTVTTVTEFEAVGAGAGAKAGLAEGAGAGVYVGLRVGLESGLILFPPAAAILVGGGAVVGSLVGGVAGAVTATDAGDIDRVTAKLARALEILRPNSLLAEELHHRLGEFSDRDLPIFEEWREEGNALYPKIVSAQVDGKLLGSDDKTLIVLKATLLRRKPDDEVRSFGNLDMTLGPRPLEEWRALSDARLSGELRGAVVDLSRRMSDLLLLERELDALSAPECPAYHGLKPIAPPIELGLLGQVKYAPVASLNPVLSWEAFPRAVDIEHDPTLSARVAAVVYDLAVWKHTRDGPSDGKPVYSRAGLRETSHRIEEALAAGSQYSWTVRPRFFIDGVRRAISWGGVTSATCPLAAPHEARYLFATPQTRTP